MARISDCPRCNAPVDGLRCGACGWTAAGASALPADRLRWNCADELNGMRCAKLGRFTESVQGTERWFCEDHYAPFRRMRAAAQSAPTAAFVAQRNRMRTIGEDAEAIAERLAMRSEQLPL